MTDNKDLVAIETNEEKMKGLTPQEDLAIPVEQSEAANREAQRKTKFSYSDIGRPICKKCGRTFAIHSTRAGQINRYKCTRCGIMLNAYLYWRMLGLNDRQIKAILKKSR